MMTYEDSKYFCFCFYSASDLFKNKEAQSALDNKLTQLLKDTGLTDLKQSAIQKVGEFDFKAIRKVKLKHNPLQTFFDKVMEPLYLNVFIMSTNWTDDVAPELFINIFCSNTDKFNDRDIPEDPKMFFIMAVARELVNNEQLLIQEAQQIFKHNNGIKGGIWKATKFALPGGTPISWAYQNFPGSSTSSSLEEWNPSFDQELKKVTDFEIEKSHSI